MRFRRRRFCGKHGFAGEVAKAKSPAASGEVCLADLSFELGVGAACSCNRIAAARYIDLRSDCCNLLSGCRTLAASTRFSLLRFSSLTLANTRMPACAAAFPLSFSRVVPVLSHVSTDSFQLEQHASCAGKAVCSSSYIRRLHISSSSFYSRLRRRTAIA